MQPHMAGTLQSKGRDDLAHFINTRIEKNQKSEEVFIKCAKSSRPFILQFLAPKARQTELRGGLSLLPRSCARQEPLSAELRGLQL